MDIKGKRKHRKKGVKERIFARSADCEHNRNWTKRVFFLRKNPFPSLGYWYKILVQSYDETLTDVSRPSERDYSNSIQIHHQVLEKLSVARSVETVEAHQCDVIVSRAEMA